MRRTRCLHRLLGADSTRAASASFDCHVYAVETSAGTVIFDAGAGHDRDRLARALAQLKDPVLCCLTHAHADHSGGAHLLAERGIPIAAGAATRALVESGDEAGISLDVARQRGIYPEDFRYTPAPVARTLADAETLIVGDTAITAIATPGHSHDHFAYHVESLRGTLLVVGDALFAGGRVVLQDTWDCNVADTCRSVRRLATLNFAAFLPGHGRVSLAGGERHIRSAMLRLDRLLCPKLFL